jgi:Tfp pilus assembly PilM family ATPase
MSSPRKRILSLNLGSQSIELAEFRARPDGGLILHGYHTRELLVDPAEGMQHAQVANALREMLDALQIKSGNVNYAIAENLVFTRFVKLPSIEEEKIERIISFEAQQNVPFPIDEVVWDYQVVGGGAEAMRWVKSEGLELSSDDMMLSREDGPTYTGVVLITLASDTQHHAFVQEVGKTKTQVSL